MGNRAQARFMAGHTGGFKFKCPQCGGLVFENMDLESGQLDYVCIGDSKCGGGCGWEKVIILEKEVKLNG